MLKATSFIMRLKVCWNHLWIQPQLKSRDSRIPGFHFFHELECDLLRHPIGYQASHNPPSHSRYRLDHLNKHLYRLFLTLVQNTTHSCGVLEGNAYKWSTATFLLGTNPSRLSLLAATVVSDCSVDVVRIDGATFQKKCKRGKK